MSRLEKKCLFASLAMHSLLTVILLVGPAFLSAKRKAADLPTLQVIPSRLVDEALFGGGNPNPKPPPQTQRIEPAQPPQPEPDPPKPVRQPTQDDPTPSRIKVAEVKSTPDKPQIKVNTKPVKRTADDSKPDPKARENDKARARSEAEARRKTAAQVEARISGAFKNLDKNLSSGTTIEMPGPGGEAYANYAQAVKSIYDQAWIDPEEVADNAATVQVKVVISRDGTVISDMLTRRSGIPALDKSVQNALDRVNYIAPFPEGAKESQRTFIINFNLKAKRLIG